jgi:hypothetical protein
MSSPQQAFDDTKPVWLVRLPQYLHDVLVTKQQSTDDAGVVATIKFGEGAKKDTDMSFRVAMDDESLAGKPRLFTIQPRPLGQQQLKAFAEDTTGQVGMVGSVVFKADLIPREDAQYASMILDKVVKRDEKVSDFAIMVRQYGC